MAYADLTVAEKKAIQDVLNVIRPSVGEMRRVVNIWKQIGALNADAKADFRVAILKLAVGDAIPNMTGLAGAGDVTRAELIGTAGILADMATVVTTWEDATRLSLCVRWRHQRGVGRGNHADLRRLCHRQRLQGRIVHRWRLYLCDQNAHQSQRVRRLESQSWLALSSNDGGSIVTGYYKIATWTDASTVILATDAGAGVDDDAAKCTQHDGTTTLPYCTIQGALDLITRNATDGDQINIKAGTAQVRAAALTCATYGTPGYITPLVLRGYTATANDGGIGEIDGGGFAMFAAAYDYTFLIDLKCHTFGDNAGITLGLNCRVLHCDIGKGASSPSGKALVSLQNDAHIVNNYVHDAGAGSSSGIELLPVWPG